MLAGPPPPPPAPASPPCCRALPALLPCRSPPTVTVCCPDCALPDFYITGSRHERSFQTHERCWPRAAQPLRESNQNCSALSLAAAALSLARSHPAKGAPRAVVRLGCAVFMRPSIGREVSWYRAACRGIPDQGRLTGLHTHACKSYLAPRATPPCFLLPLPIAPSAVGGHLAACRSPLPARFRSQSRRRCRSPRRRSP